MSFVQLSTLIKVQRELKGLSHSDLARKAKIATETIFCLEDESRIQSVDIGSYHAVLDALNISAATAHRHIHMESDKNPLVNELIDVVYAILPNPEKFYRFLGYAEALIESEGTG